MTTLYMSMRASDAARIFAGLARAAEAADDRDGAFSEEIKAEPNKSGPAITVRFDNDDMERPEMSGRTIIDWESE